MLAHCVNIKITFIGGCMKLKLFVVLLTAVFIVSCVSKQNQYVKESAIVVNNRVAFVQLDGTEVGNYEAMASYTKKAKSNGASLVVFPESSAYGWLNPAVFSEAHPIPGASQQQFSDIAIAYNIWVAAGLAEQGPAIPGSNGEHFAYDSGILVNPQGEVVLHHRKYQVLKNAFTPGDCPEYFEGKGCQYNVGNISDIKSVVTPFGKTSLLVCADAYTYDLTALNAVKKLEPDFVIIPWGVGAATQNECGKENFNATGYAALAAKVIGSAYVAGANAIGVRPYGRFRPAVYCGNSGYANPDGTVGGVGNTTDSIVYFDIPFRN